jgi:hypothetical protein
MKRQSVLVAAVLVLFSSLLFAQGRDFGGTWVLDKEKSKTGDGIPQFTVAMTDNTLTMTPPSTSKAPPLVFALDGKETTAMGQTLKAAWKGDKLETTLTHPKGSTTITWSREGAFLVHEGNMGRDDAPAKIYYKKAAK